MPINNTPVFVSAVGTDKNLSLSPDIQIWVDNFFKKLIKYYNFGTLTCQLFRQ